LYAHHDVFKYNKDSFFCVSVDTGKSVIQNQDSGIADEGTGNGSPLLLSAGKRDAALPDEGLKPLREPFHIRKNLCQPGSFINCCLGSLLDSERYILAYGVTKQEGILRHIAHLASQGSKWISLNRHSINKDFALG